MADEWKPEAYRDTYTERVEKLIADKKAGRTVTPESEPAEPTKVVDLLDALSRSVKSRQGKAKPALDLPNLCDLSKADLDRMARELDIKGRSKMSRAELENAIASALEKKTPAKKNAS
jgi:DNA end-binding protein Ku